MHFSYAIIERKYYDSRKIFLLKKEIEILTAKNEREPTALELAKYLNMNIFETEKLIRLKEDVESLEDIAERNDRIDK